MRIVIIDHTNNQAILDHILPMIKTEHPHAEVVTVTAPFPPKSQFPPADLAYIHHGLAGIAGEYDRRGSDVRSLWEDEIPEGLETETKDKQEEPFTDKYEEQILKLLSLGNDALKKALSRVNDLELVQAARDAEETGRGRLGALGHYADAVRRLGG